MICPECGKGVWDNTEENNQREQKGEKLRPDYSCKDKTCGWVKWRPKEGKEILVQSIKSAPKEPIKDQPFIEGRKENTTLMCRKDLMVALINREGDPTNLVTDFRKLWAEIEQ